MNAPPTLALTRILDALDGILIDASDEEITQAALDLGMNLKMKGSAAFMGLRTPAAASLSDFFDPQEIDRIRLQMQLKQPAQIKRAGATPRSKARRKPPAPP